MHRKPKPPPSGSAVGEQISYQQNLLALKSPLDLAELLFPETERYETLEVINEHLVALAEYRLTAKGPIAANKVQWSYLPRRSAPGAAYVLALSLEKVPDKTDGVRGYHRDTGEDIVFYLNVSMMPRGGKSRLMTEVFPIWCWLRDRDTFVALATYSDDFAGDWGKAMRELLHDKAAEFPWLPQTKQGLRGPRDQLQCAFAKDKSLGGGGHIYFVGTGGGINGRKVHVGVSDDLIKNDVEAQSISTRHQVFRFLTTTWYTRKTRNKKKGAAFPIPIEVQMGTRWHQSDPTGARCYDQDTNEPLPTWCILNIPALCVDPVTDPLGRAKGEAHDNAAGHTRTSLEALRDADPRTFSAQYQGSPSPEGGGMLNSEYRSFTREADTLLYSTEDRVTGETIRHKVKLSDCVLFASTDMAATKSTKADWTVQIIFAYSREFEILFVLSMYRGKITTDEYTEVLFPLLADEGVKTVLVENVTFGKTYGQLLKKAKYNPVFMPLSGDKVARADASSMSGMCKRGDLRIIRGLAGKQDIIDEVDVFPYGRHDDIVDTVAFAGLYVQDLPAFFRRRVAEEESVADAAFNATEKEAARFAKRGGKGRRPRRGDNWSGLFR